MQALSADSLSGSARPGYLARLRRFWLPTLASALWLALGLVPLFFFQTAVHEGAHCLMMAATGVGCRVWAPFPVSLGFGALYGVTLGAAEDADVSLAVIVAPQLVAVVLIGLLRFALARIGDERWALLTRLWLLGACVDLLNNTALRSGGWIGDWSALANGLGLRRMPMLALTVPLWLWAGWGLLAPVPPRHGVPRLKARDFWQIGVVYAALSALAVCVSLEVSVPDSDPTSLFHRVPILLQAASGVVCLAGIAACRLTREAT
jgi:hypothetical protein